jgi:hypothetical protein
METKSKIERMLEEKGVPRGGETYLSVSDARDLLADFVEAERAVVGIEGVELTDEETRPLPDAIADFSGRLEEPWPASVQKCAAKARTFLGQLPNRETVFVTLTTLTRDEWMQYRESAGPDE